MQVLDTEDIVLDTEDIMAYLDDVICFHSTFEEHLEGISRLFQMVRKSGFKLSGKKCQFPTRSVKFSPHLTSTTSREARNYSQLEDTYK